jgi:hypothetical protein
LEQTGQVLVSFGIISLERALGSVKNWRSDVLPLLRAGRIATPYYPAPYTLAVERFRISGTVVIHPAVKTVGDRVA